MSLIHASGISIAFGDRDILKSVNFTIDRGSRIALTGGNGSGKSTFLKILAGTMKPDSGTIVRAKDVRVSYLPQSGARIEAPTILDEAERAYDWIRPMEEEKEQLEGHLGGLNKDDQETAAALERRHELEERIIESGYYGRRAEIERVFTGLGFRREDLDADPAIFSGGRRMRISLGRVLLEAPEVLLLDEPTNYLDIEAREWLEAFLAGYPGGVVLVSHDRYFLDVTMNRVAEVFLGSIVTYQGNYTVYEKRRAAEMEELTAAYYRQEREIQKIEDFIERFRYNASKAALVQSRIRSLEKIERIQIPETLKKIHFTFPKAPDSGKRVLSLGGLEKHYGSTRVFNNLDLELSRGDKLALTGMNGAGKSTLMRILAGKDIAFGGTLEYGAGVQAGYFSQDSADLLSGTETVLAEVAAVARHQTDQEIRNLLGAFLFRGDDIYKSVDILSGGEKSRLALMKILLSPANLLLLDEPTSHLDMVSKDVLLRALLEFEGTLVFVAHDRSFMESLATRVLDMESEQPVYYYGGYDYYLYRKNHEEPSLETTGPVVKAAPPEGKRDRQKEKDQKRVIRRLTRREEELMDHIALLEEDHRRLEADMARPDNYTDGERVRELKKNLAANRREQETLHREWERIDAELAELTGDGE